MFANRELLEPTQWMSLLSEDLRAPRFSITTAQAIARRMRRTYCWIFLILLLAWLLKTTSASLQPGQPAGHFVHSATELFGNANIAGIPGRFVCLIVILFYILDALHHDPPQRSPGELGYGEVHV